MQAMKKAYQLFLVWGLAICYCQTHTDNILSPSETNLLWAAISFGIRSVLFTSKYTILQSCG